MKSLIRLSCTIFLFSLFASQSAAQSIWTNPITGTNPNTSDPYIMGDVKNANITVSGIGRGTGITGSNADDRYNASGWDAVALQFDDYFTFTLTPNSGFKINLTSFVYTGQASGTGPGSFAFKSSVDGYNVSIGTPLVGGATISLSGTAYQNITSAITFRFYGFNASSSAGTFSINDFTFNGTVTSISPTLAADLADHPANGGLTAQVGETINYTTTITNSGTDNANAVALTNTAPSGTSYTASSQKTSALAREDNLSTSFNTLLNTGNVLTNDFGLPSLTVVSFGPTAFNATTPAGVAGTTQANGTLTVNSNGTLSYAPLAGFSGIDRFIYMATTGVAGLPNDIAGASILVYPDITFTTTNVNITCRNSSTGSITFSASGGSGALTYSTTGAAGTFQASRVFNGLAAATYNLAVKDGNGLITTGSVVLTQPPTGINYSNTPVNPLCNGGSTGSITFNGASGGNGAPFTYSITGFGGTFQPGNVFSNLAAGTYTPVVKDALGCTNTNSDIILTNPPAINASTVNVNPACNGQSNGSITFTASGGTGTLTYSVTGVGGTFQTSNSFTGLAANTYTPVVKDANGCTNTGSNIILTNPPVITVGGSNPPLLTFNIAMATATFTKSGGTGTLTFSMTGTLPTGLTFTASAGTITGTPTQTGLFNISVIATDANNCTGSLPVTITVAPNLANDAYNVVGNTQLVANGHLSPATPFTTSATNIVTNDAPSGLTVTAVTNAATTNGGSITIDAAGKFTYTPLNGSLNADSYTYTASSNGVSATATINFTVANMIWYVNNTYTGANGGANGSSHRPNTDMSGPGAASLANQTIYVHTGSGNTSANILLKSGQTLRGAGSALTVGALSIPAGTKPTLSGTITLANSVNADGFDMSTGTGTAISSSGATGVTVSVGNIITSGAVNAVTLTNTTGSVIIAGGTQTNSTGATFNISGGTVSLTYNGDISQSVNTSTVSVSGGHASGTITFQTGTLSTTNGTGLQFDNADGTYNFNGTTILIGGDASIDILNGSQGTFTFASGTSIINPTGTAFNIGSATANSGSTCSVDYNGTISKSNSGRAIEIQQKTGGTVNFGGAVSSVGISSGVNLVTNTGATINFTAAISLNTGANAAFTATGGGTISGTGITSTISTTSGTALNVTNTTIGVSGLTFRSISSNGSTSGIVLNGTGSSGGLTVTGNGGNCTFADQSCTGGTIQNTTGVGVSLTNTLNPSFTNLKIFATGSHGVSGIGVTNFTFNNSLNLDAGDGDEEQAFSFNTLNTVNLTGTLTMNNSTVREFVENGVIIRNNAGSLIINMNGTSFIDNNDEDAIPGSPDFGTQGLFIEGMGTAGISMNITNCTFQEIETDAIRYIAQGSGTNDVNIIGNTFTHPNSNANFEVGGGVVLVGNVNASSVPATMTFDVQGNYFNNLSGIPVNVVGLGNVTGRIGGDLAPNLSGPGGANQGNTIKQSGSNLGCAEDAIRIDYDGNINPPQSTINSTWTILIKNNDIDGHNGVDVAGDLCPGTSGDQGIVVFNRDHPGTLNLNVENNTVRDMLGQGIRVFSADRDGAVTEGPITNIKVANNSFINITHVDAISMSCDDQSTICANVTGNNNGAGGAPDGNINLERRVATCTFNVNQASTAAISAANGSAPVTPASPVALTFNVNCNPPLPTNARLVISGFKGDKKR